MIQHIRSLHGRILHLLACSALCLGSYANALDSKQLESTLKAQGLSAKVALTQDSSLQGFSFVVVEQGGFWIPLLANDSGRVVLGISPNLIFTTDKKFEAKLSTLLQKVSANNKQIADKGVLKVFKQHTNSTITIANEAAKYKTYIVLDPNCPYCRDEVEKLEEYAKDSTLEIMVVGIIQQSSINKAAAFAKLIQNAKTKEEQISVLKRVFDKSFDPSSVRFAKETEQGGISAALVAMGLELQKAGLQGVPYIIKEPIK
ncbi:hypothetical protein [Helicobacter canis]|uniref:Disulfide isomerase DsbG N-terminal domain-containing protein n=1 Tax=Helicobacter canis NCTC 12740 TaxID=1357399 RepID=V8CKM6_9HELI|nr:hypothetical protein [Helicobacter canis]ETD27642.1 hypothetical protein HMPREF2087_00561 [Helicobacter canis NCTC 12740]